MDPILIYLLTSSQKEISDFTDDQNGFKSYVWRNKWKKEHLYIFSRQS